MDVNEIKENRTKKLLQFSVPAIISMVLTALITVVLSWLWVYIHC